MGSLERTGYIATYKLKPTGESSRNPAMQRKEVTKMKPALIDIVAYPLQVQYQNKT